MKGNCGECLSRWYCDINPDECDAWPDPVPQTNADHIRAMTDEELARFIADKIPHGDCYGCPWFYDCQVDSESCGNNFLNWLKQPYGGDA